MKEICDETYEEICDDTNIDIAVIGMSCVFPQANSISEYWKNLCNGTETVKFFSDEEILQKGVAPERLKNPNFVKAASVLDNHEIFDAEFFGINPREAICMDPQHRIFLECCWEAFENAGYDPLDIDDNVGVFAGCAMNSYITDVLSKNINFLKSIDNVNLMMCNDKDFLPTRVSYKLNLTGPSINVNSACSTSLVAIHLACHSLLIGESDMALAGGVSIVDSNKKGYMYFQDGIQSSDGHCRAFDADANGIVCGDGSGVVLLKRLNDAIRDGDHIFAVIKGSAVGNDGSNKIGFSAPGSEGQSNVIIEALQVSGVSPDEISFVEAHGTGTKLGDVVEIDALTNAFFSETDKKAFCPIGSVKTNMGHLNTAAGIAGFIKAVLAIENKKLPPSLNFKSPNPKIDFPNTPFYVNTKLMDLSNKPGPLYAGISSLGMGGTNCHVIIGEAPKTKRINQHSEEYQEYILILSARSEKALEDITDNMANYLDAHPELLLKDIAYTLQCGRHGFTYRRALLCGSVQEAVHILRSRNRERLYNSGDSKQIDIVDSMLAAWLRGEEADWKSRWTGLHPRRVQLPTYPFERKRFWVDSVSGTSVKQESNNEGYYKRREDIADWFYVPGWKQFALPYQTREHKQKNYLIFTDKIVGNSISEKLNSTGDMTITVNEGNHYRRIDETSFELDPKDAEGYFKLFSELQKSNKLPDSILFFWSLEEVNSRKQELDTIISAQQRGLFSILYLVQALGKMYIKKTIEFIAFTNSVFDIMGNEPICVNASMIQGMCTVMQQEYDNINCMTVDIMLTENNSAQREKMIDILVNEIEHGATEIVCAYRGNKRFVRRYDPIRIEADAPRYSFNREGVYLIFNGLEGVGARILDYLAKEVGAKLILLEEDDFPDKKDWNRFIESYGEEHPITHRIKKAINLLEYGAEYIGTISQLMENQQLLEDVERRAGRINGIINAAGGFNAKRRQAISNCSPDSWYVHFKNVAHSLMVLDQIFKNKELNFKITFSALGSFLGGYGFVNVATVTNFVKAYVAMEGREDKQPWLVQCWDATTATWDTVKEDLPSTIYQMLGQEAMNFEEEIACLGRTLAVRNYTEIDISSTSLLKRYDRWVNKKSKGELKEKQENGIIKQPRPNLGTNYIAPANETQKLLESIFSDLLGIEKIGINDLFYEIGGNSLLAVQLISKLQEEFSDNVVLDLGIIIKYPTISSLAAYIDAA